MHDVLVVQAWECRYLYPCPRVVVCQGLTMTTSLGTQIGKSRQYLRLTLIARMLWPRGFFTYSNICARKYLSDIPRNSPCAFIFPDSPICDTAGLASPSLKLMPRLHFRAFCSRSIIDQPPTRRKLTGCTIKQPMLPKLLFTVLLPRTRPDRCI
jgi:hypothetical protein